ANTIVGSYVTAAVQLARQIYFTNTIRIFFSSRRRHTRSKRDWSSDVCSSDFTFRVELSLSREKCRAKDYLVSLSLGNLDRNWSCDIQLDDSKALITGIVENLGIDRLGVQHHHGRTCNRQIRCVPAGAQAVTPLCGHRQDIRAMRLVQTIACAFPQQVGIALQGSNLNRSARDVKRSVAMGYVRRQYAAHRL